MFCTPPHTRYAQLSSSDYRLSYYEFWRNDVTESSLIAEILVLNLDNDELDGNGIQRDPREFWWADPENVTEFFKQVNNFLDARAHVCRDLTHATNTLQNKDETRAQYNQGPPLGGPKRSRVGYFCEKAGHFVRECKLKQAHELTRKPPQINHTQAPLYNSNYAEQYQVSWIK